MIAQQIAPRQLQRLACLYVRQSTLQQVFENTESTARQCALRERALALGWPTEQIVVIDQDLRCLYARVLAQPVGVRWPFPIRKQINASPAFQIDQQRAISVTAAQREIIDSQDAGCNFRCRPASDGRDAGVCRGWWAWLTERPAASLPHHRQPDPATVVPQPTARCRGRAAAPGR